MSFIQTANGEKIHYLENSNPFKIENTLILVHGNLANCWWWKETLENLPQGWKGYALDLPGSGDSPETGERHTMEYFAEVVNRFVEALALESFYLAGHSMGGGVSQAFTLKYPEKVKKLLLLDSMSADGFHVLYGEEQAKRLQKMREDKEFLKKAIAAIAPMCKDENFLDLATEKAFGASEQVFLEQPITMHEVNWIDRLSEIQCPTLFLHGEDDHFVPQDGSERTAAAIPNCKLKYLEACGHSPMVEVFEDFFTEMMEFFQ